MCKKKNSLKQSTPLKNASTSVHILEGMGSFKTWKKLIYQLETCEGSPSKLEKAVLLSYRSIFGGFLPLLLFLQVALMGYNIQIHWRRHAIEENSVAYNLFFKAIYLSTLEL